MMSDLVERDQGHLLTWSHHWTETHAPRGYELAFDEEVILGGKFWHPILVLYEVGDLSWFIWLDESTTISLNLNILS